MAINQLSDVGMDDQLDKKQVKYLNKDYSDFKRNLIEFTKFYFTDTYQDFSDASPGSIFLDLASYVGDVLSYYTDHSYKENLLAYAEEKESVISLAQGFGFKPRAVTSAVCTVSMSALIKADIEGNLETKYLPRFLPGTSFAVSAQNKAGTFITTDICDFGDARNRTVTVYATDNTTKLPTEYVVKKPVKTMSGTEKSIERVVTSPTKFLKIQLPDDNVVDIKSVVDSEGNTWNEVDNLSQDYTFQDTVASPSSTSSSPFYKIKVIKTNRRFVTRLDRNLKTELVFGSGTGDLSDVYDNPDYKSVYDQSYLQNMTNVALDTLNFTSGNSFGLAPGNTTLTITYRVAGGAKSNVASGTINKIADLITGNERRVFTSAESTIFSTMLSSVGVTNDEAARGGGSPPTVEQLRQSAIGYINAQRRIVTSKDYEKRVLSMPAKYGTVDKAFVVNDDAINAVVKYTRAAEWTKESLDPEDDINYVDNRPINTNVNLYVMGLDSNRRLANLNSVVKLNIKQFLKGYRMMTDRINIVDAFRVSIGVSYNIVPYEGTTNADVLARCSAVIAKYFNIDNWQINQPIIIDDLLVHIAAVEGVQSVPRLEISNKSQQVEGSDYAPYQYDIQANTKNRMVYPSADPCIFELRYPQTDIVGYIV